MGYYGFRDTPTSRIFKVAYCALFWGLIGLFVSLFVAMAFPFLSLSIAIAFRMNYPWDKTWIPPYIFGFVLIFSFGYLYIQGASAPAKNQGTYEQMAADPGLNTQDSQLHWQRLNKFGYSKYDDETEYMGPRGGIYTITASGNRNYR